MPPPLTVLTDESRPTLLLLSQVYVPDPASVGQHMHDVAREMVQRGNRVVVITANRGYEDPSQRYPQYEQRDGVDVVRVGIASFGKHRMAARLSSALIYLAEATAAALAIRRIDQVLFSTSPPMCALAGLTISRSRRIPFDFWIMDLNPDQIVATGRLTTDAAPVRALDWLNRQALSGAHRVIVLDEYMAERVLSKCPIAEKLVVLPPWPLLESGSAPLAHADNAFRKQHGFGDARVIMYSGNLSPVHPVETLLDAAREFRDDARLQFVFVGGGLGREMIERARDEHQLQNVRTLPYQPLAALHESLSAADVHLVTMGDAMVGIVHPCKIYGAMAVGRPILALGPKHSHVADLVRTVRVGWYVQHGEVDKMVSILREIRAAENASLGAMGRRARDAVHESFDRRRLVSAFCDALASPA